MYVSYRLTPLLFLPGLVLAGCNQAPAPPPAQMKPSTQSQVKPDLPRVTLEVKGMV